MGALWELPGSSLGALWELVTVAGICSNIDCFSDEEFLYLMNNWDKELVKFKLHLEVNCTKFKMCHIEWS